MSDTANPALNLGSLTDDIVSGLGIALPPDRSSPVSIVPTSLSWQVGVDLIRRDTGPSDALVVPASVGGGRSPLLDMAGFASPVLFCSADIPRAPFAFEPAAEYHLGGDVVISRSKIERFVAAHAWPHDVRYVIHEVAGPADAYAALSVKALTGARLILWFTRPVDGKPDWLRELLVSADAVFAASSPLRDDCERLFYRPAWVTLPPAQQNRRSEPSPPAEPDAPAVILGAPPSQEALSGLLTVLGSAGREIYWLAAVNELSHLDIEASRLERAGIKLRLHETQERVASFVEQAPFLVFASTHLGAPSFDGERWVLPQVYLDVLSAAGTPALLVANGRSALGDFIELHGLGVVCPYDRSVVALAADVVSETQQRMRAATFALAASLAADDPVSNMKRAADAGGWLDNPLQDHLFPRKNRR